MKIKVTPSAIAPIVRGLVLSRASFSCMVKTRPEGFACPGERTNESADGPIDRRPEERTEEHIRLVLDGILPQSEIEDAELAQALQHSLTQPQAQAIRRQPRRSGFRRPRLVRGRGRNARRLCHARPWRRHRF